MKEVDFSNVEVGQRVFSILYGWGEVAHRKPNGYGGLNIRVIFDGDWHVVYNVYGRAIGSDSVYPTLYYDWVWIDGPKSAFTKPETHKTGNRYLNKNSTYILSGYGGGDIHCKTYVAFLVNEKTGSLVNYPKRVKNLHKISMEEWMEITSEEPEKYEKMED
jgi:hypothetical protein